MRKLTLLAPLLLAACGGEAEAPVETKAAANGLDPGLWEVASETTAFRAADKGKPVFDTPVGTAATYSVCVGGDGPPPELFAGEGFECGNSNYYLRNGRMNITMNCTREGLAGNIAIAVDGTFEAASFDAGRDMTTYLTTDGDVQTSTRLAGRRIGECPAATEPAETKGTPE